jgi:ribosomal protein L11 methyltransferase
LLDALEQWQCFRVEDMGKMENQPWSRQSEDAFPPLVVGDGLVVLAPWHRGTEPHDRMPIYINPGSAFGTGYHESTQAALHLFERLLSRRKEASMPPPGRVIDVGAESGILSIAAAKLGAGSVYARDIDPTVIEEVNGNIGLNGVGAGRITMEVGNLLYGVDGSYDVLFANILLAPLLEMLPAVRGVLEPGGVAIFSGMTRDERDKFLPPLLAEGLLAVDELTKEDWWGVAAENPA